MLPENGTATAPDQACRQLVRRTNALAFKSLVEASVTDFGLIMQEAESNHGSDSENEKWDWNTAFAEKAIGSEEEAEENKHTKVETLVPNIEEADRGSGDLLAKLTMARRKSKSGGI